MSEDSVRGVPVPNVTITSKNVVMESNPNFERVKKITTGRMVDADGVDHPGHYNQHPAGIECIDVIEHMSFNVGASIKHLWRAGLKPGEATIKDLKKASWYIQREIERLEKNVT